ncbi:pol [Symbiodinium sp. CCMP2592]|nr:pol [Symbiodinium sp. CCMP2592]
MATAQAVVLEAWPAPFVLVPQLLPLLVPLALETPLGISVESNQHSLFYLILRIFLAGQLRCWFLQPKVTVQKNSEKERVKFYLLPSLGCLGLDWQWEDCELWIVENDEDGVERVGSPTELAEDEISENEGEDAEMPAKLEKRKRAVASSSRCDPRVRPVPDSDDEDSPSKRPSLSEEKPLTAREIRELLLGHVCEMRTAWDSFKGRLDCVEKEQQKSSFEISNLQTRTRVLEKDHGQHKQSLQQHSKVLDELTSDVKKMQVKIDELASRPAPSDVPPGASVGPVPLGGDPWSEYLQNRKMPGPTGGDQRDATRQQGGNSSDDRGDFLSDEDKRTLVIGGWLQDTKRSIIEEEAGVILMMPEAKDLIDSDKLQIFGPRRSVGLLRFKLREGESFQTLKGRMWEFIRLLGRVKHSLPSTAASGEPKTLWASFVKSKNARLRSAHVSMIRRVAIVLAKDNQEQNQGVNDQMSSYDCDWNMGTIWCGSEKLGGWVNISAVARIAGCSTDDSKSAFERELKVGCLRLVRVQHADGEDRVPGIWADKMLISWTLLEIARDTGGWSSFDTDEFHWVTFRDPRQWRGTGIGIALDKFDSITWKVATERGIWAVARIRGLGRVVLGSVHCHTGVTTAVYQAAAQEFARHCPRRFRHLPVLCGADANEVPHWEPDENGTLSIGMNSNNLEALLHEMLQHGVRPVAPRPSDQHTPSHFPRDSTRRGRQIDMIFSRLLHVCPLCIEPERRHTIGSDHAIVMGDIMVAGGPSKVVWGNDSRPRWVVSDLPDIEIVDEDDLIALAKQCTRPRASQQYRDDDEVKGAICAARASGCAREWKRVHKLRRAHKRSWVQARFSKILNGDWDQYRQLQNERKRQRGWWGNMLAENSSVDLAKEITSHLESKMTCSSRTADEWEAQLACLIRDAAEDDKFVPFTLLDLRVELQEMKCRSAVGPDGIGVHLLRECVDHDVVGPNLLSLVNHIVKTRELPSSWERSFLALLAKCRLPAQPSDLRPICVSSAFHKLVNRLVCARTLPLMRQGSKISCCGKGRQAADLIGCLSRLRDVTKEWCQPLILCKLDVAGAFDKVDRAKVAELLRSRLRHKGVSCELRYLLAQLAVHEIVGNAPGGKQVRLRPDNGIKQGAPESAELPGLVVDSLLSELVLCKRWGDLGPPLADVDIDLLFYQDDIFIVETNFGRLCRRIGVVDRCLQQAGLTLAKEKTKIVANEHYTGPRRASVGDDIFSIASEGESLKVLGISFSLSRDASEQAKELIGRTRDAAASHKELLCAPGAWLHKEHFLVA